MCNWALFASMRSVPRGFQIGGSRSEGRLLPASPMYNMFPVLAKD